MNNLSLRKIILGYLSESEITQEMAEELLNKLSPDELVVALLDLIDFNSHKFRRLVKDAVDCMDDNEQAGFVKENEIFDFENDLVASIERAIEFNDRGSRF